MKLYAFLLLVLPALASASMGLDSSTIAKDCAALGGTLTPVNSIQSSCQTKGYTVDFYLNANGQVARITWHGHTSPPLNTLLGSFAAEYKAAVAAHPPHVAERSTVNETTNVIVKRRGNAR